MTEDNLFQEQDQNNNNNEQEQPEVTQPPVEQSSDDLFKDHLSKIINSEGKPKYDSVPKALEALDHSQRHITSLTNEKLTLEKEVENLRESLAKQESVEEVIERLTAMNNGTPGKETPPQAGLDEQAVHKLVQDALNNEKQASAKQANIARVHQTLTEKFGDKARDVVNQKAKELGTSPEQLGELSAQNPNLVLALFGNEKISQDNPSSSSIRIPVTPKEGSELAPPEKSLLAGASSKDQAEYMRKIKEDVYKKYNVEV